MCKALLYGSLIETPNNSTSVLYYFNIQDGGALWENDVGLQGQEQSLEEGRMPVRIEDPL